MADISTTFRLNVKADNLADATTQATKFRKELEAAGVAAGKINVNVTPPRGGKAAMKSAADAEELGAYGVARSAVGTGAAARDFAKQSQGLGGLVHLYATFAANLFAVGAAFTALSKAMDTTNMVKGLDQLGAASGRALGTLSKRIVEVTDGSISMRDAMEATAKASAAGLDSSQITRMATAAKKASSALGVDMADALSRLTRGVSKLEPELLDELGLFTKVGKASEDYARTVGKSVTSLTDFEKRQAFANAVLKEAEQKFAAIDSVANPYSKLLASLQNVSQAGLELVNKVLGPLVKYLAESPTALSLVIAAIGATLVKTAIPALSSWREGLQKTAQQAADTAKAFRNSFDDSFVEKLNARFRIPDLSAQLNKAKEDVAKATKELYSLPVGDKLSKVASLNTYISTPADQLSSKNILDVNKLLKNRQEIVETGMRGSKQASEAFLSQTKAEIAAIETVIAKKQAEIAATKQAAAITSELRKAEAAADVRADAPISKLSPQGVAIAKAEKLQKSSEKAALVSAAVQNTAILGVRDSVALLNKEIGEKGLTGWDKFSTLAKGGLASISSRLFGIVGALGNVGAAIAIATLAFEVMSSILGKNSKEVEAFSNAAEDASAAAQMVSKTLDNIDKFNLNNTVQGVTALANALKETVISSKKLIDTLEKADSSANWFDRMVDDVKKIVGKDLKSVFVREFSSSISAGLDTIRNPELRKEAEDSFKKLLNIKTITRESISEALAKVDPSEIISKSKELNEVQTKLDASVAKSSSNLTSFSDSSSKASTSLDELINSLKATDNFTKFGSELLSTGLSLSKAFTDPKNSLIALLDAAKDASKLRLFSAEDQKALLKQAPQLELLAGNINRYEAGIRAARQELEKLKASGPEKTSTNARTGKAEPSKSSQLEEGIKLQEKLKAADEARARSIVDAFSTAGKEMVIAGSALVERSLQAAQAAASVSYAKVILSTMTGIGTSEAQASLKREEINTQLNLIAATEQLAAATEKSNLLKQSESLGKDIASGNLKPDEKAKAEALKLAVDGALKVIEQGSAAIIKAFKSGTDAQKEALKNAYVGAVGAQAQRTAQVGRLRDTNLEEKIGKAREEQAITQSQLQADINRKNARLELLKITNTSLGLASQELFLLQQSSEQEVLTLTNAREQQALEAKRVEAQEVLNRLTQEGRLTDKKGAITPEFSGAIKNYTDIVTRQTKELNEQQDAKAKLLATTQAIAAVDRDLSLFSKRKDFEEALSKTIEDRENAELGYREKSLGLLKEQSGLSDKYTLSVETELAKQKEILAAKNAQRALDDQKAREVAGTTASANKVLLDPNSSEEAIMAAQAEWKKNIEQINTLYSARSGLIKDNTAESLKYLDALEESKRSQMELNDFTSNLTTIFGELGSAIGDSVKSLVSYSKQSKALDKIQKDRLDKITDENEFVKQQDKDAEERADFELSSAQQMAGATKKMFAEKTAAYKAFNAVEKAIATYRLVMSAKQMAQDAVETASAISLAVARAMGFAGEAGASAAAQTPGPVWTKIAAGVAAFAFVASLVGKSGKTASTTGMTAKDRQETQGTGMEWKDGKQVETGRGVLGDPTAKSESISKSIDLIAKTSVEGLSYSNKMLTALNGIKDAIAGTVSAVAKVTGIRSGTGFGTEEGTKSSGIKGLFGSSTSKEILDSGIKLNGTFEQLAKGAAGAVSQYETLLTTVKKSGFLGLGGSTKSSVSTIYKSAEQGITDAISSIFTNATATFVEVGSKMGKTAEDVIGKLANIDVSSQTISLRGLKGDDLEKEFSAVISSILDDASRTIFSDMLKYQQLGEGVLETVIRVVDANDKIKLSLDSVGKKYANLSFDTSEALVKLAGGLENFLDRVAGYKDTFLTDAEKLAPIQAAVSKTMSDLGYASVDTRAEFKALVNAQDLTTESGQKMFTALMEVASSFGMVTEAHQQLVDDFEKLENDKLRALGKTGEARVKEIAKETDGMNAVTRAQYDRNEKLKEEISILSEFNSIVDSANMASFTTEAQKLTYTRNKERQAISESNLALFDMVTGLKLAQLAAQDAKANMDKASKNLVDGFETIKASATSAKQELENFATQTLTTLRANAKSARTELENFATQTLATLRSNAKTAREALESFATSTLETLRSNVKSTRDELESFATNTLETLRSRASTAAETVKSLKDNIVSLYEAAIEARNSAKATLAGIYNQRRDAKAAASTAITQGYVNALQQLQDAQAQSAKAARDSAKAIKDSLRGLAESIKEFLKNVGLGELGISSGAEKLLVLQSQFAATASAARGGDSKALAELPKLAEALLTSAQSQAGDKAEYLKTFIDVTNQLDTIAKNIDAQVGPAETEDSAQSDAIKSLAEAQANLAKWEDWVTKSGADRVLKEVNALDSFVEADSALSQITTDLSALGVNIADLAKSPAQEYTDAIDAYKNANAEVISWTNAIKASKIDIEAVQAEAKAENSPSTLIRKINEANEKLAQANTDVSNWLTLMKETLKVKVPEEGDATYAELESKVLGLNSKFTDAQTNVANWIKRMEALGIKVPDENDPGYAGLEKQLTDLTAKWDTATEEVSSWIKRMEALGITVPDETDDGYVGLVTQLGKLETKWTDAQSSVSEWITLMESLGIKVPEESDTSFIGVKTQLGKLNQTYKDKLAEVKTWEETLARLGIEFTPYGEKKDPNLSELSAAFETAKQAFTDANAAVKTWIENITGLATKVTPPAPVDVKLGNTTNVGDQPTNKTADAGAVASTAGMLTKQEFLDKYEALPKDKEDNAYKLPRLASAGDGKRYAAQWLSLYELSDKDRADNAYKLARLGLSQYSGSLYQGASLALPGFEVGTNYVPQDMIAQIHKGEAIVPAKYNNKGNEDLIAEVKALRDEVIRLRTSNEQTEYNTRKVKETLDNVTLGGQYMQTKAV